MNSCAAIASLVTLDLSRPICLELHCALTLLGTPHSMIYGAVRAGSPNGKRQATSARVTAGIILVVVRAAGPVRRERQTVG